mmetsp:Transcript_668/g.1382  ORF Transcript_668/g.1382 Transcript_668/m.1382 type:complete len:334 (+) Transcript_668:157-1158(+)
MSGGVMESSSGRAEEGGGLTREEEAILDRQIRVWGVDTQCAIRNAKVAVIVLSSEPNLSFLGTTKEEIHRNLVDMNPRMAVKVLVSSASESVGSGANALDSGHRGHVTAAEVVKNLTLAGVGHLEVVFGPASSLDLAAVVSKHDVAVVFGKSVVGINRVAESLISGGLATTVFSSSVRGGCGYAFLRRPNDPAFSKSTTLAAALGSLGLGQIHRPRKVNKMYFLLRVVYAHEKSGGGGHEKGPSLAEKDAILSLAHGEIPEENLRPPEELVMNYLETEEEMPAVSAIIGGSLAQEVIKAISGKGELMNNFYFFSAYGSKDSGEAKVEKLALAE